MSCNLSRREVLRFLMIALPANAIGWKRSDFFDRELVCVHVYDPGQELPAPLTNPAGAPVHRSAGRKVFHVGLPELILCRTKIRFLHLYPYFWPISREDVRQLQGAMEVLYQKQEVTGKNDLEDMHDQLLAQRFPGKDEESSLVVIFTLNDATCNALAAVVDACRSLRIDELVVFKDPSRPPYLCSFASRQKGFKRPPPIG